MYELTLLIVIFLYPILAYRYIPKLPKRSSGIVLGLNLFLGILFTYLSTAIGYTFENNILDTITINIFLFSIFGFITWMFRHFAGSKKWPHIISLSVSSIIAFGLFITAFGPSEACGQRLPESSQYFDRIHKITHAGYQYGLMDYGSRFIICERHSGLEKIIGLAENPNYYYEKPFKLQVYLENKIVVVEYSDYQNIKRLDTLYIQAKQ